MGEKQAKIMRDQGAGQLPPEDLAAHQIQEIEVFLSVKGEFWIAFQVDPTLCTAVARRPGGAPDPGDRGTKQQNMSERAVSFKSQAGNTNRVMCVVACITAVVALPAPLVASCIAQHMHRARRLSTPCTPRIVLSATILHLKPLQCAAAC